MGTAAIEIARQRNRLVGNLNCICDAPVSDEVILVAGDYPMTNVHLKSRIITKALFIVSPPDEHWRPPVENRMRIEHVSKRIQIPKWHTHNY